MRDRLGRWALVVSVVPAAVVSMAGPAPARAVTFTSTGCHGALTAPFPVGTQAGSLQVSPGNWQLARAPCSRKRNHVVTISYRFWGFDASIHQWVFDFRIVNSTTLAPRRRGHIAFSDGSPHFRSTSIDAVVSWRTGRGKLLGRTHVDFSRVADYRCVGGAGVCQVRPSAEVGAYFYFPPP
jgi:hypothetical protein